MAVQTFKEITRLRKSGQIEEAWNLGVTEVKAHPNDNYLKGSFFWVCYDYLKPIQEKIQARANTSSNYRPFDDELERINFLLDWVIWLNLPYGGFEYPRLMFLFRKNLEFFPKLVHMLAEGQENIFSDEDKQPFMGEHGELSSLMLGSARQLAKAWLDFGQEYSLDVDAVLRFLDISRNQCNDKKNKIWLDYDEAKCLIRAGRYDAARKFLIPVLKKKSRESWAWGALAASYMREDRDVAIKLFAEGISHARDEVFALKLLKGIAPLLASAGKTQEASMCLQRAVVCYEKNGWRLKQDIQTLTEQPWYDASCDTTKIKAFINSAKQGADQYLYGELSEKVGMVVNLHQSGQGCHIYIKAGVVISTPFAIFNGKKPKLVDYVSVKYTDDGQGMQPKIVEVTLPQDIPGVEHYEGDLRVAPGGFGFVDDTFIPPSLIKSEYAGLKVKVLRFQDINKTKNKLGWKAVTMELQN
jgi:hypothetical protein